MLIFCPYRTPWVPTAAPAMLGGLDKIALSILMTVLTIPAVMERLVW